MATYDLETPRGKKLTIESDSPENAMRLADQWDLEDHAASEATRLGVNPSLVLRQMQRESGGDPGAVSPKGARGPMQLMPPTAKALGVNSDDPYENVTGGVTYLKQQLDAFGGDERKALAAYNAGPGAVRKYGGVPPYPETQAYVAALAGSGASQPAASSQPPKAIPGAAPGLPAPIRPNPTIAQDAASGFAQPFVNLGHDVMENYRRTTARAGQPPPSLMDAAKQSVGDLGSTAKIVGDLLGVTAAPVMAAIRPAARAIGGAMPAPTLAPQLSFAGGKPVLSAPRELHGEEAQGAVENALNTALMGARAAAPKGVPVMAQKPMALSELKSAKDAAYAAVDASGHRFANADVQAVADSIGQQIADLGGPKAAKLLSASDAMHARLDALAKQPGGVPLTQLEKLRGDVYKVLVEPGGADSVIGSEIRKEIDGLIAASGNREVGVARDMNTRYMKAKEVTDRIESANLAQETAGTGGNQNAIRQKLRPLIDPKSPQRIRNLTPEEVGAIRKVTKGTAVQNLLRLLTAFDPTAGKLQATLATGAAGLSHGLTLPLAPIGMVAKAGEHAISAKNVQELLDLISLGGAKPIPPPAVSPTLALGGRPALSILSPAGLAGAGVTAAPLSRLSDLRSAPTSTRKRSGQRAR